MGDTVETANSTDPVKLVQAFKIERSDHYKASRGANSTSRRGG